MVKNPPSNAKRSPGGGNGSPFKYSYLENLVEQYMNHELPDVQADFRKGRGARDQTAKTADEPEIK